MARLAHSRELFSYAVACLFGLSFVPCIHGFQTSASEIVPGVAVERELRGGETHTYQLDVLPGQFLHAVADQQGIDLRLELHAADGRELTASDLPNGAYGPESVSYISESGGKYLVVVTVRSRGDKPGKYQLRVDRLHAATSTDRQRMEAEISFDAARKLRAKATEIGRRDALAMYQKALNGFEAAGDQYRQALTLEGMGRVSAESSEFRRALQFYTRAIAAYQLIGNQRGEAINLINSGGAYDVLGDLQLALANYSRALELLHGSGEPLAEATALNNIGKLHSDMADWQKAIEYYGNALPLLRAGGQKRIEAITLTNFGAAYRALAEPEKALGYFQQALSIQRAIGDKLGEANTLTGIGGAYVQLDQVTEAIKYYEQGLALQRAGGDPRTQGTTLKDIGLAYSKLGDSVRALDSLQQAVKLSRTVEDRRSEGIVLGNIGDVYRVSGQPGEALDYYRRSLASLTQVGDRNGAAKVLMGIARTEGDRGNLEDSRQQIEKALALIEEVRSNAGGQQQRASYFASIQDSYEYYIDLLMQMHRANAAAGYDIEALEVRERARARSLLEMLAESHVDFRQGVDAALLEQERRLSQSINAKAERLMVLQGRQSAQAQVSELNQEMAQLEAEYQQVEGAIRSASPRYAAITQPKPLKIADIRNLLEPGSTLLQYSLGENRSYVWAITPSSVISHELPKRADIEKTVRELYELLTARGRIVKGELQEEKRKRIAQADTALPAVANRLSEMVLAPVKSEIRNQRLVIVADGALQHIPFAMLPVPGPLLAEHEVVELPSASTLAMMRKETEGRRPAPKLLAILADPVFDRDDDRARTKPAKIGVRAATATHAGASRVLAHLASNDASSTADRLAVPRLPFTRREADRIIAVAPKGDHLEATDFRASVATASSGELSQYQYVHFATHGYADSDRPDLSALVLSMVDEQGRPQNGFLRASEIYNLKLPAELVVLSACQTGLGKQVRGEGVVGLTRAFMYAGAARVVVSLWNVNDEATAELMASFYQAMWRRGLRPAAALRDAQLAMMRQKRWSSPYYWAAFIEQGDWR